MRLLTSADVLGVTVGAFGTWAMFFPDRPVTGTVIAWVACLAAIVAIRVIINQKAP